MNEDGTDAILACCKHHSLKVIFLDSLVRFHNADENDAAAMGEVAVQIQRLKSAGLTVIALHHNRKSGGALADRMRGTGEIMAAADTVLHLAKWPNDPNRFTLEASKLRHVNQSEFRKHWFERRELEEDKFEFVMGGDSPASVPKAPAKKTGKPSSRSNETKNQDRALKAIQQCTQKQEGRHNKEDIRAQAKMGNAALGRALKWLEENGKIDYTRSESGKYLYSLKEGEMPAPNSGAGGAD